MPDSNRPRLFARPEKPPFGYEAIRDWLKKPRPLLRSVFDWVPLLLSNLYDAGVYIKKNARPGAAWVQRATKKAEPVVKALAEIGKRVRNLGRRTTAAADAFRDPEGKNREAERKALRAGDTTQRYGEQITAGADVAGAFLTVLKGLAGLFKPEPPISIRPTGESRKDAEEAPTRESRSLPHPPDKRHAAPTGGRADGGPTTDPPRADPESTGDAEQTPPEIPHQPPAPGAREEEPPAPGAREEEPPTPGAREEEPPTPGAREEEPPAPGAREEEPPTPGAREEEPPTPGAREEEPPTPATAKEAPAAAAAANPPEPDPKTRSETPAHPEPPPPPTPPAPPENRFEGVPKVLLPRVEAFGERTSATVLHALILDICLAREWTSAKQLADWLSVHRRNLVQRHIGPLVDDGFLILRFPDKVRSRKQAYRTNPEKWPPSG